MSDSALPERASLEFLRKLAKDRLRELRRADPTARLAAAQLAVAREHGFASWRALKAAAERRQASRAAGFFDACARGDIQALGGLLAGDPDLAHAADPEAPHPGWTGLHAAAKHGQPEAARLLLEHGADPNAREAGDNTHPLHWAAAAGDLETARVLVNAGADVHGRGDVHELDTIGWATVFRPAGDIPHEVVALLRERGARHHIVSALAVGDPELVRQVAAESPAALARRLSRFEQGGTALHFAIDRQRYDLLELLIELGADLEAGDASGRSALAVAMLRGDREAMRRLHAAGARPPTADAGPEIVAARLADRVTKGVPAIVVPDIGATLDWYSSIGFRELGRHADGGVVNWAMLSFGKVELMLGLGTPRGGASLWIYMEEVDTLYGFLKRRQLRAACRALAGGTRDPEEVHFEENLYDPFYGGRQFSIRDPNGYTLVFYAP